MRDTPKNSLRTLGFDKEIDNIEKGLCPLCGQPVNEEDFKDEASRREFAQSGMCSVCQERIFAEDKN